MSEIRVLGIDLGKDICSVVGMDVAGKVLLRRRMRRDTVLKLAAGIPPCIVAMEACCGAHHLGRQLREQGHDVRLMSPEYVRPYVKAQKNDDRDAEAIAEAATRPTMRFVDLKQSRDCGPDCDFGLALDGNYEVVTLWCVVGHGVEKCLSHRVRLGFSGIDISDSQDSIHLLLVQRAFGAVAPVGHSLREVLVNP